MAVHGLEHAGRRRSRRIQDRGGADGKGKRQRVAEPVGMVKDAAVDNVALTDLKDVASVGVAGIGDVAMQMHDALRIAGRARAVEPEGHVVLVRVRGHQIGIGRREQRRQMMVGSVRRSRRDHLRRRSQLAEGRLQRWQVLVVHDHDPGAAVLYEEAEVLRAVARVDRNRHRADAAGRPAPKMTAPSRRRQVVQDLQSAYEVSERRACAATGFARSTQRYRSRADPQPVLRQRLRELAASRVRYGGPAAPRPAAAGGLSCEPQAHLSPLPRGGPRDPTQDAAAPPRQPVPGRPARADCPERRLGHGLHGRHAAGPSAS